MEMEMGLNWKLDTYVMKVYFPGEDRDRDGKEGRKG